MIDTPRGSCGRHAVSRVGLTNGYYRTGTRSAPDLDVPVRQTRSTFYTGRSCARNLLFLTKIQKHPRTRGNCALASKVFIVGQQLHPLLHRSLSKAFVFAPCIALSPHAIPFYPLTEATLLRHDFGGWNRFGLSKLADCGSGSWRRRRHSQWQLAAIESVRTARRC